ncbi:nuclear transport factor 2 family protein [Geodermatophilus sp. SYSU D01105]
MTLTVGSAAVEKYAAAWREPDATARRTLLETCWAEDGVYCDPLSRVEGRDGLAALIGSFQEENPGAHIDVVSGVDEHDGYVRFGWRMVAADGSVALEGTDFGELDGAGALRRIVGFFGPLPPA